MLPHSCHPGLTSSWVQMANMLEGGGKTPILPPQQLQDMGFKLVRQAGSILPRLWAVHHMGSPLLSTSPRRCQGFLKVP